MSNPYGNDPYGQQPPSNPYGAPAPAGGFNEPQKTDGVSIAALVTGLVCCAPVSLILGFVGLGRTKGGQRKGRGLAITGIILGLLGLVVWVGIGILAALGIGFFASIVQPEDAEVGQCINIDEDGNDVLLREAECKEEHDGEIVAVEEVTDENRTTVEEQMSAYCLGLISEEDQAKIAPYLQEDLNSLKAVIEDPNDVEVGDHLVCYIEPDDKLDEPIL